MNASSPAFRANLSVSEGAHDRSVVSLGAVMLAIGVFTMLYVCKRRLWVWLAPSHPW
ncbi:MAG: cytochrome c biogenesis protein ResB [Burkholderiales bacterium]|nr:cytochrome c biogenesis protein ResB [Burkholderiales bacterium]